MNGTRTEDMRRNGSGVGRKSGRKVEMFRVIGLQTQTGTFSVNTLLNYTRESTTKPMQMIHFHDETYTFHNSHPQAGLPSRQRSY
mmetsp:Transcript_4336/g.7612  ORF Transcript_4336/g.7612 Transcript_4336/m.7612 type:complete len:85 (-) Transcript_4336:1801-2055(-)